MNKSLIQDDLSVRQLALDTTQSFIVKAPAGSGKTELLTQRFLMLLSRVSRPEEILALTFTNKAANEMRQRIIKALLRGQNDTEPTLPHQQKTWLIARQVLAQNKKYSWNLIDNPNRLRIQTIDAFCTFLTKNLPLISGLGSTPSLSTESLPYFQEAVANVFCHLHENDEWGSAIRNALAHLDNDLNKLNQLLILMLSKRDQWLPYIHFNADDNDIRATLETTLQRIHQASIDECQQILPLTAHQTIDELLAFTATSTSSKNDAPMNQSQVQREYWQRLRQLLLTSNDTWRKRVDKDIGFPPLSSLKNAYEKQEHQSMRNKHKALIESLSDITGLDDCLAQLGKLPPLHYSDYEWETLCALFKVLKISAAELRLVFRQHGKIDFIENAQAAITALSAQDNPTDLALILDYQIKHILIDEFQDTSLGQLSLLQKLTIGWEPNDGRTLFIVGDPMQSIYRFREAEVAIFLQIWQHGFQDLPIKPLQLSLNFRSDANIVNWNNEHFSKIFSAQANISTGAVPYNESTTPNESSNQVSDVAVHENGDPLLQDKAIVEQIQKIKIQYPHETIAILVRSRSHLMSIITLLRANQINFTAIDIDPLSERPCIQDLFALTQAISHLGHRIAWLAILRSPICGLTLRDLSVIAENKQKTIWAALNDEAQNPLISTQGQNAIQRIIPILSHALRRKDRDHFPTVIENVWLNLGYAATFDHASDIDDAKAYFELLHNLESFDIEHIKQSVSKLFAPSKLNAHSVQIMTIHSAKGLEFDNVLLPHLEKMQPNKDKPLFTWLDIPFDQQSVSLLMAPIQVSKQNQLSTYDYIQRKQALKDSEETKRLFYVATTRAKHRLHLFYSLTRNKDGNAVLPNGSFLQFMYPSLHQTEINVSTVAASAAQEMIQPQNRLRRLSPDWRSPLSIKAINTSLHQKVSGFCLSDETPRLLGTCYHRIMEIISRQGVAWWLAIPLPQRQQYIQADLAQTAAPKQHIKNLVHQLTMLIDNTLKDATGQWILSHRNSDAEYTITQVDSAGSATKLIMDNVFTDQDGTRWIIDYKTAEPDNNNIASFIDTQVEQHREKMHRYAAALNEIEPRKTVLMLYFPAIAKSHQWQYTTTLLDRASSSS